MKKYIIPTLLYFSTAQAQTYIEFDQYVHSTKVRLKPGKTVEKILSEHDYNLAEKDWVKITRLMNGLIERKKSWIYLPPKISFKDYLKQKRGRSIASTKPMCHPISKNSLLKKYGEAAVPYIQYFETVTSRKIQVMPGDDIRNIISADQFSYGSIAKGAKLTRLANGLKDNRVKRKATIYLPFCADSSMKRSIASLSRGPIPAKTKEDRVSVKASLVYGSVDVNRGSKNLSMNVVKMGGAVGYKLEDGYSLTGNISGAKFMNVTHSDSEESASPTDFYPEFGLSLSKSFGTWSASAAYDMLNYFLIGEGNTDIILEPTQLHRLAFKPYYAINDNLGVFASAGLLRDFEQEVSGIDFSAGLSYAFGGDRQYLLSGVFYNSDLSTEASSTNDKSSALMGSLAYRF